MNNEIVLSIIIPVYNAVNFLPRCMDSILACSPERQTYEVLLLDDGSTDESPALCDEYAEKNPGVVRSFHMENSGGPARPRNKGINEAKGNYLFFCDNDDYFGKGAINLIIKHAMEWNPDVMLVRMGETGRKDYPRSMFTESSEYVDLYNSKIMRTLGPWKLFRRQFLIENDITFPEDCTYDDSLFTMKAYLCASKISLVADIDYYYWTMREDESNLSVRGGGLNSTWKQFDKRFLGLSRFFSLLDKYADPIKGDFLYEKALTLSYGPCVYLADGKPETYENSVLEMKKLLLPHLKRMKDLSVRKHMLERALCLSGSFECYKTVRSCSLKEGLGYELWEDGLFRCSDSKPFCTSCEICDIVVQRDVKRIKIIAENEPSSDEKVWMERQKITANSCRDRKELTQSVRKVLAPVKRNPAYRAARWFSRLPGIRLITAPILRAVTKDKESGHKK